MLNFEVGLKIAIQTPNLKGGKISITPPPEIEITDALLSEDGLVFLTEDGRYFRLESGTPLPQSKESDNSINVENFWNFI